MNLLGKMIGVGTRNQFRIHSMLGYISGVTKIPHSHNYLLDTCPSTNIDNISVTFTDGLTIYIYPLENDFNLGIMTENGWIPLWEVI